MSQQASPLTIEGILKSIENSREQFREEMTESRKQFREEMKESRREFDRRMKKTDKRISDLGSRVGRIIENMVKRNIVEKFQDLGYEDIDVCYERVKFGSRRLGTNGEIDLLLENGSFAILIEVKTTLETSDVRQHIERIEKYRRHVDAKGRGDHRHFIGAVAGAVVEGDAEKIAHENGIYVIVQSGKAVEIVAQPEGFKAKEW